ncbi:MAG: bifunctional [glutamine synthetase] adenylyltransferase/[glutamine synthetase]-adenylyl-L-tyrosine phosphorylase [Actinomycetota bacterium]
MEPGDVTANPEIAAILDAAADPELARTAVARLSAADPAAAARLGQPARARAFAALACASRSLSTAVIADPTLLDVVDADDFTDERDRAAVRAELLAAVTAAPDGGAALRRQKRREFVRIAVRDLLGIADLVTVGRELTSLAEACLEAALALAEPRIPFAIIGMGKLGGNELNYSSDVDVLFVHSGDDSEEADRVGRAVLSTMSTPTADGLVFRTDADLRPEGRAGAISRTVESYVTWYGRWARHWEFQALLKARPVAGDADLGREFMEQSRPFVWREVLDPEMIREARKMKARAEAELGRKGLGDRELKRGRGGIRDIEFAVQLLQLVHGRHDPQIRSATTLVALAQLAVGGYVERRDVGRLGDAYVFLRTVEHRLQLRDERQTHTLPSDEAELTLLARVLGYRDQPRATGLQSFLAEHRAHQATVRALHERLFFAPLLDTLAGRGSLSPEAAEERLAAFGFVDAQHTRDALRELTRGFSRTSRVLGEMLPVILDWLSGAPDPDLGLLQLRRLAEGPTRGTALAVTFRDSTGAAERACRVLGSSRFLGESLLHQPAFLETLGDDDALLRERTRDELVEEALETLQWRSDVDQRRAGLRRFKRREFLRIAARDVLGLAPIEVTARELSNLAEAAVEAALQSLSTSLPFAVIGMGRLGGRELSYASDIDVLFVYAGDGATRYEDALRLAADLVGEIGATTAEGQTFRIDANLRPEGKKGALARSLDAYASYYEEYGLPWEFQSLLRARPVAGNADVGAAFMDLVEPYVVREPFPEEFTREIRRVKVRVEQERIPPGEDPQFHLKLGKGALTDVEFAVQLLQLQHCGSTPAIRTPATIEGIHRLVAAGLLAAEDGATMEEAYRFCERARNARYLVLGQPGDALPGSPEDVRIGRLLGFTHEPRTELRDEFRRVTRRARRVVDRVFYGRAPE